MLNMAETRKKDKKIKNRGKHGINVLKNHLN